MPITIDGTGSISGLSAGGLPDNSVITADIAAGAVTQAKRSEDLTLGTAQNSTSGTAIDFTGIPSWVKRVTVIFNGVSTNGSSSYLVQIGSGSIATTGYNSLGNDVNSASGTGGTSSTSGFLVRATIASTAANGHMCLTAVGSNVWVSSHAIQLTTANSAFGGGNVTLSGTLDRIRITTVNGTDTFDAGSINILYE